MQGPEYLHGTGDGAHGPTHQAARAASAPTRAIEVYDALRDQIVRGQLRPNERIVEFDLAERLSVSRTPVREALQMLARDWLVISRRRGWVVYEFTQSEIRQLSEIRAALEGYAAGLAARNASHEDIDQLQAMYEREVQQVRNDRRRIVEVNDRFHRAVNDLSGNQLLVKMTHDARRYYFNAQAESHYSDEELWKSMSDHDFIIESIRRRDAETAARVARNHVEELIRVVEHRLRPGAG